jgi:hypothetical protein
MPHRSARARAGRPPKFKGSRRPVTVTLPEETLDRLRAIDSDRAIAIVKAVEAAAGAGRVAEDGVRVVELTRGQGLVVIGPCSSLRQIPWLTLVEITPTRHLLALPPGTPTEVLEVAVSDLLADKAALALPDGPMLERLLEILRRTRRASELERAEILLINLPEN